MSTNTDYVWYWYVRKKGRRYYVGLVDENGAAPAGTYDIEIYYDEIPDEITEQDDNLPIPKQFELGFAKGVAAELMAMSENKGTESAAIKQMALIRNYEKAYNDTVDDAKGFQLKESQQPTTMKPFDLRDD